jgi:hypothetical protein
MEVWWPAGDGATRGQEPQWREVSGDYAFFIADSGVVVSAATRGTGQVTDYEVFQRYGLHVGRMHGVDPFGLPAYPHLRPVEVFIRHDGGVALLGSDGSPVPVSTEKLAQVVRGWWNGSDDLQILGRFMVGSDHSVSYERTVLGTEAVVDFQEGMERLAFLLGTDVYFPAGAGRPRYIAQVGAVVADEWRRIGDGIPRFDTNWARAVGPLAGVDRHCYAAR